ncbi:MAG: ABC transporter ATP-binding protein [Dehalococcoidia bacterium]
MTTPPPDGGPLLQVRDLRTYFFTRAGVVKAVDGVDFDVGRGEIVGLVGESGSGKSNVCLSILNIVPKPAGKIVSGRIALDGIDLLALSEREMRGVRGRDISMILQDPLSSLNPVYTIGNQVGEAITAHRKVQGTDLRSRVIGALTKVHIPAAPARLKDYPHQFSGGMRQRVMAAIAVSCAPKLLIADEPTTALDVTIQAQFLQLMRELRDSNMGILYVTHDLGVVAQLCDRVLVMYAGRIVESGPVEQIFRAPRHPYTAALIGSVPVLGGQRGRLFQIEGQPPNPLTLPDGCPFAPRCPHADDRCRSEEPVETAERRSTFRCWHPIREAAESRV